MLREIVSRLTSVDVAIDLGNTNTVIFFRGEVRVEPSLVAIDKRTGEIALHGMAVGVLAENIISRFDLRIEFVKPVKIRDRRLIAQMLDGMLRRIPLGRFQFRHRIAIALPARLELELDERFTVFDSMLVTSLQADALVRNALVVDIGGETCEIGTGFGKTTVVPVGLESAIIDHVKTAHGLLIGEKTADRIKRERPEKIRGRDMATRLPREISLTAEEIHEALSSHLARITAAIRSCISDQGEIILSGGGSLLAGFAEHLRDEMKTQVQTPESPFAATALGLTTLLKYDLQKSCHRVFPRVRG